MSGIFCPLFEKMVLRWPSQQGGEKGQNTWDLICSQLPNLWAGFPRAAPTLNGFSSPISSCRPTQLLSQLPTPLTRAKTSNSCPEERFQRFFFFFSKEKTGQTQAPPILGLVPVLWGRVWEGLEARELPICWAKGLWVGDSGSGEEGSHHPSVLPTVLPTPLQRKVYFL